MRKYSEIGKGWNPLVDKLMEDILEIAPETEFSQIKEKYGSLRVYANAEADKVWKLIAEAERVSKITCEICGQPGENKESESGWWRTRCDKHREVIA